MSIAISALSGCEAPTKRSKLTFSSVIGRTARAGTIASFAVIFTSTVAFGQVCGDSTHDGAVTVTDGIVTLRAAAGLASSCDDDSRVCDVNGDESISVSDGVAVLRIAANLDAQLQGRCPFLSTEVPSIAELIEAVTLLRPTTGVGILEVGVAPVPTPGAPNVIARTNERRSFVTNVSTSASQFFILDFALEAGIPSLSDPILIVAAETPSRVPLPGFFRLPLDPSLIGRDALFEIRFAPDSALRNVTLRFAVESSTLGVSQYVDAIQVLNALGLAPICGDGVRDDTEQCDPVDVFFLSDEPPCGGSQCLSSCVCVQ